MVRDGIARGPGRRRNGPRREGEGGGDYGLRWLDVVACLKIMILHLASRCVLVSLAAFFPFKVLRSALIRWPRRASVFVAVIKFTVEHAARNIYTT